MLRRHPDVWIVADEIYEALTYDGMEHFSIAQIDDMKDRTILINGLSKSYAMTGWRIGYAASPAYVAKYMGALQSHQTSNPNTIAQYASVTALDEGEAFIKICAPCSRSDATRCGAFWTRCLRLSTSRATARFTLWWIFPPCWGKVPRRDDRQRS